MRYRAAIRYVEGHQRYHVEDIEANSIRAALERVVETVPDAILAAADLVEIRPSLEDENRPYSPA